MGAAEGNGAVAAAPGGSPADGSGGAGPASPLQAKTRTTPNRRETIRPRLLLMDQKRGAGSIRNEEGVGSCSSVGEMGCVRISRLGGNSPHTNNPSERIRMASPRMILILFLPRVPSRVIVRLLRPRRTNGRGCQADCASSTPWISEQPRWQRQSFGRASTPAPVRRRPTPDPRYGAALPHA